MVTSQRHETVSNLEVHRRQGGSEPPVSMTTTPEGKDPELRAHTAACVCWAALHGNERSNTLGAVFNPPRCHTQALCWEATVLQVKDTANDLPESTTLDFIQARPWTGQLSVKFHLGYSVEEKWKPSPPKSLFRNDITVDSDSLIFPRSPLKTIVKEGLKTAVQRGLNPCVWAGSGDRPPWPCTEMLILFSI